MLTAGELANKTKPFAREDRGRSWLHLWSTLAILIGLLGTTCLDVHSLVRVVCSILAGLVFVRMFVIYHDHQHGTILRGSLLADALMLAYGLCVLTPSSIWKRSHNHHHKNNGKMVPVSIGSFPLMTTVTYAQASRWERFGYAAARHPMTMLLSYGSLFVYGMCLRPFLARPREHWDGGTAIVLHAVLIAVLAIARPDVLVFTYVLPLTLAAAVAAYLFYAQHNFPGVHFRDGNSRDYVSAALRASSYIPMNPVLRWFTGNIGYHHVHHLNAHIPFYRLPEAMAQLEELQSPGVASLSPLGVYRCLRLKLWDPEQQRMVSFAGL